MSTTTDFEIHSPLGSFTSFETVSDTIAWLGSRAADARGRIAADEEFAAFHIKLATGLETKRDALAARLAAGEFTRIVPVPAARKVAVVPPAPPAPPAHTVLPAEMTEVVGHSEAVAHRGTDGSIGNITYGGRRVGADDILKALAGVISNERQETLTARCQVYSRNSLYSYDHAAQLVVVLRTHGTWDPRKHRGEQTKDYRLVDLKTGLGCYLVHGPIRGDIRTNATSPAAGVLGAVCAYYDVTKAEARRRLRSPAGVRLVGAPKPESEQVAA